MTVQEHYNSIGNKTLQILEASLKNEDLELLTSNHSFLFDYENWLEILKDRPEHSILMNAVKEYQMSILSNNLGLYQQAFMGLRFFLERSLVAILFSANEIELNLWKKGERDTYWNELTDNEKGIFSHKFCRAFFPELKDEIQHFNRITLKVYRECSEYVHGNQSIIEKIPSNLEYSEEIFKEWNIKANIIKRVILFCFCLRYLKSIKQNDLKKIENLLKDELGGISPITEILSQ